MTGFGLDRIVYVCTIHMENRTAPTPTNCAWARSPRSKKAIIFSQPDGPGGFVRVQHMKLGTIRQKYWILEKQVPQFQWRFAKEGLQMQRIGDMVKHSEPVKAETEPAIE